MIKLLKYLKKSSSFIIMIVILLFVQAYCDLSLPSYTSDIVDVGIQQGGIENAVPLQIRKQTLQEIELFLTEEQKELVEQCYQEQEELWVLQNIEESKKEELKDRKSVV